MTDRINSAQDYHRKTSYVRYGIKGHALDFEHYPVQTKSYGFLRTIDFQKEKAGCTLISDLFSSLQRPALPPETIDFKTVCAILFYAYGKRKSVPARGMTFHYRTVPSAGGLYPCHLYLSVQGVSGLETGLYYCDMIHEKLGLIQSIDSGASVHSSPKLSIFITAQFYTSAWKYQSRAFRYMLLDAGHLVENACLAFKSQGYLPFVHADFKDERIFRFLSLDASQEVPLAAITLNRQIGLPQLSGPIAASQKSSPPHFCSSFLKAVYDTGERRVTSAFDPKIKDKKPPQKTNIFIRLPEQIPRQGNLSFEKAVEQRCSKRNYIPSSFSKEKAMSLFAMAVSLQRDGAVGDGLPETELLVGVCCERVDGMDDGFYLFFKKENAFVMQRPGQYHRYLAQVCLDQHWMAKAAVQFVFMADLQKLERQWGARGYRYMLMEAGRIAQRIYLGAEGLGLGCCAVGALYDTEAQELFDLDDGTALFYVVSVGLIHGTAQPDS